MSGLPTWDESWRSGGSDRATEPDAGLGRDTGEEVAARPAGLGDAQGGREPDDRETGSLEEVQREQDRPGQELEEDQPEHEQPGQELEEDPPGDKDCLRGRVSRAELAAAIEAVLVVATQPVPAGLLAELLEVAAEQVEALCLEIAGDYERTGRGFELARVAGGYRLQSRHELRGYVERFIFDDQPHKLSAAALETLAIVAYKQPISRSQVAAIRGVNADGVMRVLCQRGYVEAVGRDDGPGQAVLFGTTTEFLERLGLDHLGELPPLEQFVPDAGTVEALEHVLRAAPLEQPD